MIIRLTVEDNDFGDLMNIFLKKFIHIPAMTILQLPTAKMSLLIMHCRRHIRGIIRLSGFGRQAGMLKYFLPETLRL